MIIVLKPGASDSELQHILERIEQLGFKAHLSRGVQRTIIGLIGDEEKLQAQREKLRRDQDNDRMAKLYRKHVLKEDTGEPDAKIVQLGGLKRIDREVSGAAGD